MLLNIVKTRYLDLPIYLDVGQIVSGYTLERSASIGGGIYDYGSPASPGNNLTLGGAVRFADSPTITYTPLTGEKFLESFLAPVEPGKVFALIQAGYAADFILELSVDSLNGLRNRPVTLGSKHHADPEFYKAIALIRELQDTAAIGLRVERATNSQPSTVVFFRADKLGPETQARISELRNTLGLAAGQSAFKLVSSPLRGAEGELAVNSRSLSQMMTALALNVEVPAKHLERKLAPPMSERLSDHEPLLRVRSGPKEPDGAFVSVPYEGQWFWIDNDDWRSKRTFSSILFLFTVANAGSSHSLPTLTIPTR